MNSVSSVDTDVLSVDCLLAGDEEDTGGGSPHLPLQSRFIARSIVVLLMPIAMVSFAALFWCAWPTIRITCCAPCVAICCDVGVPSRGARPQWFARGTTRTKRRSGRARTRSMDRTPDFLQALQSARKKKKGFDQGKSRDLEFGLRSKSGKSGNGLLAEAAVESTSPKVHATSGKGSSILQAPSTAPMQVHVNPLAAAAHASRVAASSRRTSGPTLARTPNDVTAKQVLQSVDRFEALVAKRQRDRFFGEFAKPVASQDASSAETRRKSSGLVKTTESSRTGAPMVLPQSFKKPVQAEVEARAPLKAQPQNRKAARRVSLAPKKLQMAHKKIVASGGLARRTSKNILQRE